MIKYIGSKRTLLDELLAILHAFPELDTALDLFSGTSRVGHAFKKAGYPVLSNDHNAYAHTLATCYVEADREDVEADAEKLIAEFNRLPGRPGYFTETFCVEARFFQPHNGERVDAVREAIEQKGLSPTLKAVLLTSLMKAADRVDSTCGVQMAFVKKWAPRSYNDLELRMPEVLPRAHKPCRAYRLDANQAARELSADVAYIDPPYNQHSYLSNYHIWESLVLWDKPDTYGVARKRMDCRTRKSDYNSKRRHRDAFQDLIDAVQAKLLVVSFNNEGYQSRTKLEELLAERGPVFVIAKDFRRYVGAQIGVYSPAGDKVGKVSHLRNQEFIYLVATDKSEGIPDVRRRLEELATVAQPAAAERGRVRKLR
ncbi:MAG: DNA adenine methylase, partial [Myxococcota bacterium]